MLTLQYIEEIWVNIFHEKIKLIRLNDMKLLTHFYLQLTFASTPQEMTTNSVWEVGKSRQMKIGSLRS